MRLPVQMPRSVPLCSTARICRLPQAADERGVSASALSHSMRMLEGRLDVRLFNRTTRSVAPAEAGQLLLATLVPALADVAKAFHELTFKQEIPTGTLRLNVSRPAGRLVIKPLLPAFTATYPSINVELVADDGLNDIVDEGFGSGLRFGESLAGRHDCCPAWIPPGIRQRCLSSLSHEMRDT